jgi:multidrug efflux pump subunit AcrA (membrane-fusion protein)
MTTTAPQGTHPKAVRPRFHQRAWFIITVTALIAVVLGTVIGLRGADATSDPRYKAQTEKLNATESDLAFTKASLGDTQDSLVDAEDKAADLEDQLDIVEGRLDKFKAALDERRADLKKREADLKKALNALKDRKARLDKAKADLLEREEAVTAAEALIADTTVPGDGTFEVGVDIERGLYRSAGKRGCHYTVTGDANGTDVLIDKQTPGAATVSLRADTWFVTRGCAEWTRQ